MSSGENLLEELSGKGNLTQLEQVKVVVSIFKESSDTGLQKVVNEEEFTEEELKSVLDYAGGWSDACGAILEILSEFEDVENKDKEEV